MLQVAYWQQLQDCRETDIQLRTARFVGMQRGDLGLVSFVLRQPDCAAFYMQVCQACTTLFTHSSRHQVHSNEA